LLQQQNPAASSDGERLAAGISTIGLQTKRLSGAQRKKLMREKKMEGTWTVEKLPTKTPSSQSKERARSTGGVKRPHCDSSSPSLGKQQPKKPRSTLLRLGHTRKLLQG
jgi:hypothetical protein